MIEQEILWAVYSNTDLNEGRGQQYVKHFCKLHSTAIRLAKKGYVQGTDCPVESVKVLVLEGQRVLPTALLKIEEGTMEDEQKEKVLLMREDAFKRAKEAGLSDEDIKLLRMGELK